MRHHHRLSTSIVALVLAGMALGFGVSPVSGQTQDGAQLPKRLIGDYGYWSRTQQPPYSSAQIPFAKLTHINHAGVSFDASGALVVPDGFLEPELIQKAYAAGVKVLLLLGGDFPALEMGPSVLSTLVANLQAFVHGKGYDGVDIDWEYPSTSSDRKAFFELMSALREAFLSPYYLISADVNQRGWATFYDPISLVPYMLRVDGRPGFITYDDGFSTYYRVRYSVWERGLGGTYMWSLDADYDGHSQDLLEAMFHASLKQPQ